MDSDDRPIMCSTVCLDQILQKVEHVTVDKCMGQFDYAGMN